VQPVPVICQATLIAGVLVPPTRLKVTVVVDDAVAVLATTCVLGVVIVIVPGPVGAPLLQLTTTDPSGATVIVEYAQEFPVAF
jgi:hypothetical protein